jgi:hypothetical protein
MPVRLDDWAPPQRAAPAAILDFAERRGQVGFTVDDLRLALCDDFPRNPGSVLGSLCSHGRLRAIREEPSALLSSKGRRVRRFILASEET